MCAYLFSRNQIIYAYDVEGMRDNFQKRSFKQKTLYQEIISVNLRDKCVDKIHKKCILSRDNMRDNETIRRKVTCNWFHMSRIIPNHNI